MCKEAAVSREMEREWVQAVCLPRCQGRGAEGAAWVSGSAPWWTAKAGGSDRLGSVHRHACHLRHKSSLPLPTDVAR